MSVAESIVIFAPHPPRRVPQRVVWRHGGERGAVEQPERTSGGGEDQPADFAIVGRPCRH